MLNLTIETGRFGANVWCHLEEGDPCAQAESFVIATGATQAEAVSAAIESLADAGARLSIHRPQFVTPRFPVPSLDEALEPQPSLFETHPPFKGETYDPELDGERLTGQLAITKSHMLLYFPVWQSLSEIRAATGYPEASISARLRDLTHDRFGGFIKQKRRRTRGTWEYRIVPVGGNADAE